ncbi:hypothetical protein HA502_13965 [Klebsiella pneumoniae]|uniref:hypothetical protein n=1 Tax=Klebsiella pneumoniae TaxID=573 RepID=UPI00141A62A0|nr:hypothetical protein [Klebsiella pneumoniae]HBQ6066083.1 hypothetical protein [Klebsiella pneumoniae subsp. pneumoniae]EIX9440360.1 hypothetical protein [Klebsiella pneumoniae]MBZ1846728.1 hypothetical protein [Klebsiella pneumoniae]MCH0743499.1 hypothetical protein [Klebsiella pneumoniae]MEA4701094.1 hypothetical protein [Klebsiella pneumoniae]
MKITYILLPLLSILPLQANAGCWIVSNLHGKSSFSGDAYDFVDDGVSGAVFKLTIDNTLVTVTDLDGKAVSDIKYVALSDNTAVGRYDAGGGITVETWSVTTDKKVLYSKVMNIPGFQTLTSTKAFVGDVAGSCDS